MNRTHVNKVFQAIREGVFTKHFFGLTYRNKYLSNAIMCNINFFRCYLVSLNDISLRITAYRNNTTSFFCIKGKEMGVIQNLDSGKIIGVVLKIKVVKYSNLFNTTH